MQIISFDIWNTLIRLSDELKEKRTELFFNALKPRMDYEVFAKQFDEAMKECELLSESTGLHMGFSSRIEYLCNKLHIPFPQKKDINDIRQAYHLLALAHPPKLLSEKTPMLFAAIKESKRKIAVVSNVGLLASEVVEIILLKYSLAQYIDYLLFSDVIGYTKPSHKMYSALVAVAKCKPDDILHVGDQQLVDVEGAQNAGIPAIKGCMDDKMIHTLQGILQLQLEQI